MTTLAERAAFGMYVHACHPVAAHAARLTACCSTAGEKGTIPMEAGQGKLEADGEVQEAGKRVAEAREKVKWETHFVKQDLAQQRDNSPDIGYERAAVGHDKPAL